MRGCYSNVSHRWAKAYRVFRLVTIVDCFACIGASRALHRKSRLHTLQVTVTLVGRGIVTFGWFGCYCMISLLGKSIHCEVVQHVCTHPQMSLFSSGFDIAVQPIILQPLRNWRNRLALIPAFHIPALKWNWSGRSIWSNPCSNLVSRKIREGPISQKALLQARPDRSRHAAAWKTRSSTMCY